jgi:Icc-related predicted phosphoesterase
MKLHVTSDLHLDFDADYGQKFLDSLNPVGVDALVIAGDFMEFRNLGERTEAIKKLCERYALVFMTMGNHDFYGSSFYEVSRLNLEFQEMFPNLVILEPGMNYIHEPSGIRIAGGVLWYPDSPMVQTLKGNWPDWRFIKYSKNSIFRDNQRFRVELNELAKDEYPDIVISHMLPTPLSIHPKFAGSEYNCFFVSDETELIRKIQPKLWIHGHTHYPFDYKIGATRIYCNPRAYPREGTNPDFMKRMLIEVTKDEPKI